MTSNFDKAIERVMAEREVVDLLGEKVDAVLDRIKALRGVLDVGVLDMQESCIVRLERDSLFVSDALQCAKDSVNSASKEMATMIRSNSEACVAIKLEYEEDIADSKKEGEGAIEKIGHRVAESMRYREVVAQYMKQIHIPTLAEK